MNKKEFEERYIIPLAFDKPIKYKEFKFYPVPITNYYLFLSCSNILTIKKDRIPDAKIISMSYMEYLCHLIIEEAKTLDTTSISCNSIAYRLYALLGMCLNEEHVSLKIDKDKFDKPCLVIDNVVLNGKQFDDIKDIILFQNLPNYIGIDINPELEEDIILAEKLKSNHAKSISLEQQMMSLTIGTGYKIEDIRNMTIRKFFMLQKQKDKEISYKILKLASMTGLVKFETGIVHYLEEEDKDPMEDKLISYESLKQKINH